MTYYVIEHPTRGMFVSIDENKIANATFSVNAMRGDDRVERFPSIAAACRTRDQIAPAVAAKCEVRRSTDWKVVG